MSALQRARAASQDAEDTDQRLPAFRLLSSFVKEGKSKWRVVNSEADLANSRLALHVTPTRIAL
jgi:hypothetical protein